MCRINPTRKRCGLVLENQYTEYRSSPWVDRWCSGKVWVKKGTKPPVINLNYIIAERNRKDLERLKEHFDKHASFQGFALSSHS